ncbi:DUF3575 domain-containing protein [Myxococcota bacterium]|nr:DUF3575 domain-containing protein [Myxococcota bacterium]MBU1430114.1 DUF3575 domain-containing protein [Myxococcota bacterium]MBU1896828.1 DUF3575 domain-containing protein [Myxococcota bacterium]
MRVLLPILLICLSVPAFAEEPTQEKPQEAPEKANSVNLNPMGIATGNYNLNYERLFDGTHGVLLEGGLSMTDDGDTKSSSMGAGVGYRWHWRGKQNSGFLGVQGSYYAGTGEAKVSSGGNEMMKFDVDTTAVSVVPNIGKRWAWDFGLNITFRLGVGWASYSVSTDSKDPLAKDAVKLVQDLLELFPVALDGELSVGWIF